MSLPLSRCVAAGFLTLGFTFLIGSLAVPVQASTVASATIPLTPPDDPGTTPEQLAQWKHEQLIRLGNKLIPGFKPPASHSSARASQRKSNQYVDITLSHFAATANSGNFGMGTTGGDPADFSDNNKRLIYGWAGYSNTTYSTVYIAGETLKYGSNTNGAAVTFAPQVIGDQIRMVWSWKNIDIVNTITIVDSLNRRPDTAEITYEATNNGLAKQYGMRIMLDTMIGDNDGAPINVVGFPYSSYERDFLPPNIPQFWQAFEGTPGNPGLTAQGTLYGADATIPDRFVVADWTIIYGNNNDIWNYSVHPAEDYTNDSATAIWWNPATLNPGETRRYTTYYGLGTGVSCESDLGVNFTAPAQLNVDQNCDYSPNPFSAQVVVENLRIFVAQNVRATLTLPAGLQFAGGSVATLFLGNISPSAQALGSWSILATGSPTGNLRMHLEVVSDNTARCELDRDIYVPPLNCTPTPAITDTPTLTPTNTPKGGTPLPSRSPTLTPTTSPTGFPTFTPTPTIPWLTWTPSQTPTPSPTPPPTPTPDLVPPVIMAAGYGTTDITTETGGHLEMFAWVEAPGEDDVTSVRIQLGGQDAGFELFDDGTHGDSFAGDHLYSYDFGNIPPGTPAGLYLLELAAFDEMGNQSPPWPYFEVSYPGSPAPEVPRFERLMRETIEGRDVYRALAARAPAGNPILFLAGYMSERVHTDGGTVHILALAMPGGNPIQAVELLYNQVPTGVFLQDDGSQGDFGSSDGVYGLQLSLGGPIPLLQAVLELSATDTQGNRSDLWPYLNVRNLPTATPTNTPTATPSPTTTPTLTPTPLPGACFTFQNPTTVPPRQKAGEWVVVTGACSTDPSGTALEYRFDWGDTTGTGWDFSPQAQHIYTRSGIYTITLYIRNQVGGTGQTSKNVEIY